MDISVENIQPYLFATSLFIVAILIRHAIIRIPRDHLYYQEAFGGEIGKVQKSAGVSIVNPFSRLLSGSSGIIQYRFMCDSTSSSVLSKDGYILDCSLSFSFESDDTEKFIQSLPKINEVMTSISSSVLSKIAEKYDAEKILMTLRKNQKAVKGALNKDCSKYGVVITDLDIAPVVASDDLKAAMNRQAALSTNAKISLAEARMLHIKFLNRSRSEAEALEIRTDSYVKNQQKVVQELIKETNPLIANDSDRMLSVILNGVSSWSSVGVSVFPKRPELPGILEQDLDGESIDSQDKTALVEPIPEVRSAEKDEESGFGIDFREFDAIDRRINASRLDQAE